MVIIIIGLLVIIFAFWKFGLWKFRSNILSRGGAVGVAGMALVVVGIVYGDLRWKSIQDRKFLDSKLLEIFHQPPDRLEIEGDSMDDFHGVAYVNGKSFQVKTKWLSANDQGRKYEVIVVPIAKP